MTRTTCAVKLCGNTSYNSKLTFFKLPKKPIKLARWLRLIGRLDLLDKPGSYFVCQSHFRRDDLDPTASKNILRQEVDPSLNLPSDSVGMKKRVCRFRHQATQYETKYLPRIIPVTENKSSQNDEFDKLCDLNLPKEVALLVKKQAAFKYKFYKNPLNKKEYFYLRLFHTNPNMYAALRQTLRLPKKKTLAKIYSPHITKTDHSLIEFLQLKVDSMTDKERNCSVLVRVVPLKPHLFYNIRQDKIYGFQEIDGSQTSQPARLAVVVMARGIFEDWLLPASYALFSSKDHQAIASWFHNVLTRLFGVGLNVRLCISNLHSDIISLTRKVKKITVDKPFFFHEGRQIYFMHDPGYLMFKIRHVLMEFDLQFQQLKVKWAHVLQFYENDSKKLYRLAPALTDCHVTPGTSKRNLTKELLSETVAAGISAHVDFGQIDESARGVVKFISTISKLNEYMCSSTMGEKSDCVKVLHGPQTNIITETLSLFRELQVFKDSNDVTENVMFIKEFKLTLQSVLLLFDDLNSEGYAQLPMKYLNMNVLNRFITKLKRNKRISESPTAWRLVRAYRNKLLSILFKPSKNENRDDELSQFISSFYNAEADVTQDRVQTSKIKKKQDDGNVRRSDYSDLNLPEKHQFMYVCAFVLMKTLQRHTNCTEVELYGIFDESEAFNIYKEYRDATSAKLPMIPRDSLIEFFQKIEAEIQMFFKRIFLNDNNLTLMLRIKACTNNISFERPCECFPEYYLRDLYIRIRLFHQLTMNNKNIKHSLQPVFTFQYFT